MNSLFDEKNEFQNNYALFVDLLGFSTKLAEVGKDPENWGKSREIKVLIGKLSSIGAIICEREKGISGFYFSDSLLLVGNEPNVLFKCGRLIFQTIHYFKSLNFQLVPIRAAMTKGPLITIPVECQTDNYHPMPITGTGIAKAHHLEKMGRKGMTFYITESVKCDLRNSDHICEEPEGYITILQQLENFYEINWLDKEYLDQTIGFLSLSIAEILPSIANNYKKSENRYEQQIGISISQNISRVNSGKCSSLS